MSGLPGMNVLFFPLYPFVLIWKSKWLNNIVLFIEFIPLILIGIVLWLCQELLLIVPTFFISIFNRFKSIILNQDKLKNMVIFVISIAIMPIFLFVDSSMSFFEFLKSIFTSNLEKTKAKNGFESWMSDWGLKILIDVLRDFKTNNIKMNQIPVKIVI